ncbi:MAG: DUF6472 family protein [Lachnospiraceae bacterium]|nr:hypothetical protein [Lachnospiraceae bacterium]MCR4684871.1 DUF6472 family protein [Lachnospiraceae bacterium]
MENNVNCESCGNYLYDEEFDEYYCSMDLDEDEYGRIVSYSEYRCPYYQFADEYQVVRKQI